MNGLAASFSVSEPGVETAIPTRRMRSWSGRQMMASVRSIAPAVQRSELALYSNPPSLAQT